MSLSHVVKCPLCGEEIKGLIYKPNPIEAAKLDAERVMLALHICKDSKIKEQLKMSKNVLKKVKECLIMGKPNQTTLSKRNIPGLNVDNIVDRVIFEIEDFEKKGQ